METDNFSLSEEQTMILDTVRKFLARRFNRPEKLEKFQNQLDHMIANLEAFDYLTRNEDDDTVSLSESIRSLLEFRSVDPLYAAFLVKRLVRSSFEEKILALESGEE